MHAIRHASRGLGIAALLLGAAPATAQLPGTPVLQNAFANSSFTAAIDAGGGPGASTYAVAGAWGAPRLQLSVGLGAQSALSASRFAWGVRAGVPLLAENSALGVAAFVGIGGTSGAKAADTLGNVQLLPLGVTIGFRSASTMHGVSGYVSPIYEHYSGGYKGVPAGNLFRTAAGVDLGLTGALGLTLGAEFGQAAAKGTGGPSGVLWGVGFSYALRRP